MESVRILHCADLHLGAQFSGLPPRIAAERANDQNRAFMKIINMCSTEKIQLLLIAGDLFDTVHAPGSLVAMARDAFASIPGTFVAVAPGNHDPAVFDSPYRARNFWPGNSYVFNDGLAYLDLNILKVRLWGAGFSHVYQDGPMLLHSWRTGTDYLNICVMHGDVVRPGGGSTYNPVTPAMIADSGMDYLALGHIHKRSGVLREGATFYAYPGSPEGLGFDETGERGVYVGEVSRGACELRFSALNRRAYVEVGVDATGQSRQQIISQIRESVRSGEAGDVDNLIRVTITGAVTEESYASPEAIAAALSDVFYLKLNDKSVLDASGGGFTLRDIFIRKMNERIALDPSDESLKLALKLGLRAFNEKVGYAL